MMKTQEAIDKGHIKPWAGWESGKAPPPAEPWWNPQYGTPFAARIQPRLTFLGVPRNAPPWGTLPAPALVTQTIAWPPPLGTPPAPAPPAPNATGRAHASIPSPPP